MPLMWPLRANSHAGIVRMAADRGLAVLCQKPLAPSFAEASALVAQVGDRCRLMVHENWRFRRYYRDLAGMLREGRIGEVVQGQMVAPLLGAPSR